MKKENTSPLESSFLDLSIHIEGNKFNAILNDKLDAFPFYIVRKLYRDSNLQSKTFYAEIASEILRLATTSSEKSLIINFTKIPLKPETYV